MLNMFFVVKLVEMPGLLGLGGVLLLVMIGMGVRYVLAGVVRLGCWSVRGLGLACYPDIWCV